MVPPAPLPARDALEQLRAGNRRFAADLPASRHVSVRALRESLVAQQRPFAIVLGCSDSRVPAEIVFDQGIGDLFVIRVAGNIVAPSLVGSVEFAAEQFGTRLVVVLGHSGCGAIAATLQAIERPDVARSGNLLRIVERIRPVLLPLLEDGAGGRGRDGFERRAVRANVLASANQLRHGSEVLERLTAEHGLLVVGAEYDLATGQVDFFDVPAA